MNGILEGIRVLDFGRWIAGPYCAHILASLGADVVRVERPKGEDDRYLMPVTRHGEGAQFLQCNGGKRSLSLRMTSPEGREVMRRMIAQADVVVANYSPSGLRHFGLDYDTLRAIRPDIILASASAYGTDGPMAERIGFDGVGRMRTGEGAHVEGSLVGASLNITNQILMEEATGFRHREPTGNRSPMSGPSDVFRARDGWFIMQVIGQKVFERWCRLIGREDLLEDPRFASDDLRGENGEGLSRIMRDWAAGRSRDECIEILGGANIGCGPVLAPSEVVGGALDLRATFMRDAPFPDSDPVPIVPPPARLSRGGVEMSRPPLLGEHSDAVLASYGSRRGEIDRLR